MGRAINPYFAPPGYPTDPTFDQIGTSLGKALFGDPVLAQQQQKLLSEQRLQAAQAEQARAAAGLDTEKTAGVHTTNSYLAALPDNAAYVATHGVPPAGQMAPAAPPVGVSLDPNAPPAPTVDDLRGQLGRRLGMIFGAQGSDHIDPTKLLAQEQIMMGGDAGGRQALIGQGQTPGEGFAVTPDRADAIAKTKTDASLKQADSVANIEGASSRAVAGINAGATIGAANINRKSAFDVASIKDGKPKPFTPEQGKMNDQALNRALLAVPGMPSHLLDPAHPEKGSIASLDPQTMEMLRTRTNELTQAGVDPNHAARQAFVDVHAQQSKGHALPAGTFGAPTGGNRPPLSAFDRK